MGLETAAYMAIAGGGISLLGSEVEAQAITDSAR